MIALGEKRKITSLSKLAFRIQNMCVCIEEKQNGLWEEKLLFHLNDIFQPSKFFPVWFGRKLRIFLFFFFPTEKCEKEIFLPRWSCIYLIRYSITNSGSSSRSPNTIEIELLSMTAQVSNQQTCIMSTQPCNAGTFTICTKWLNYTLD